MAIDAFSMLEQDHRLVERLLDELAESEEGPERQQLVQQLQLALEVHMAFEEASIYPLVAEEMDEESAEEANVEHTLARDGLAKMAELVDAPGFGAAVEMVKGGIGHHVEEEEGEIFPEMRSKLDDEVLERLTAELRQAKEAAGLPPLDLEAASKDELLDAARAAGIEGTSKMTKDELKAALTAADG